MNKLVLILILFMMNFSFIQVSAGVGDLCFSKKELKQISKMIKLVVPNLESNKREKIASHLHKYSQLANIDPKIMIAIIDTESNFVNEKVSATGDLSLAQINTVVWNKELKRIGREQIDPKKLRYDEEYALMKMTEILYVLKSRHAANDKNWYARYHSRTKAHKTVYLAKVKERMRAIASIEL